MARTILIVPGLHGSGADHWQSWWQHDHSSARLVRQSDWSNPNEASWLVALENAIIAYPNSLIVAHSLGTILTARLAKSRVASLVAAALLVAPADVTRTAVLHRRTYEFGTMPHDRLPFPSLVVASRDDVYLSFQKAQELASDWGSDVHDLGYAGHINVASGFGRWPDGYALARQLVDKPRQARHTGTSSALR